MRTQLIVLGAALLSVVIAQSTSPTATSSAAVTTHSIGVSPRLSANQFVPNTTTAAVGDILEFHFFPPNHSVIRAPFQEPCIPYNYDQKGQSTSFFSGFHYLAGFANPGDEPTFSVRVNDTEPIFIYCAAPDACIGDHMIGVINPNATWTLDAQLEPILNGSVTYQLVPGEAIPGEGDGNPSSTSTSAPSATGSSGGSGTTSGGSSGGSSLSGGAIAGIAIGGAAVLILAAALIYICGRKGGIEKGWRRSTHLSAPAPIVEANYGSDPSKSPAANSHASPAYEADTYHSRTASPSHHSQPGSPGYNPHPTSGLGVQHPPYDPSQTRSPPPQPPVELPTSQDPGNSPLPGYQPNRGLSWHTDSESRYRPQK